MRLLIDGYNVLHQSGLLGKGRGGVWLERGRKRLLDFLRESLEPSLLPATHVVFDAYSNSSIATEITSYQEIKVYFSLGYENADELIEKLIREHPAPKSLTVVSSDHRIQRCAKAHRCRICDSSVWFDELPRARGQRGITSQDILSPRDQAAAQGLSNYEVQLWLKEFGITEHPVSNSAEPTTTSDLSGTVRSEPAMPLVSRPSPSRVKPAGASPKKKIKAKSESKPQMQGMPPSQERRKVKQAEPSHEPQKASKLKLPIQRAEKKDMPRARKRATRPLPDGYKFPEIDAVD